VDKSLYFVFSNPIEGQEDRFHAWYDKHVEDISRLEGFASAQRYEIIGSQSKSSGGPDRQYIAVYEIEGDVAEARARLKAAAAAGDVERPDMSCVKEDIYGQMFAPIRGKWVDGNLQ
jgi:hypothetical protein